jgi:hypothetical protein
MFWLAGVLILLALQFRFPPRGADLASDTWSNSPEGKLGFYLLSKRHTDAVSRNTDSLIEKAASLKLDQEWVDEFQTTFCLLGPAREPTDDEWNALLDWVQVGGRLVYATPADAEPIEIPRLGLKTIPDDSQETVEYFLSGNELQLGEIHGTITVEDEQFAWQTELELSGAAAEPLLTYEDRIQAVRQRYGEGQVVIISGDSIFTNIYLLHERNPVLAWRLIEAAGADSDWIQFDEFLNNTGTPKMMSLLFDMPIRPTTLQFLLVVCLFCWFASHRFGPFLPESSEPRRNIVDHTDMMGNLMFRKKNGSHPLRIYLRQLIYELRLKQNKGRERRILAPIALRMGVPVEELIETFKQAASAARSNRCEKKSAARLIHKLSLIRAAATSR